MMPACETCGKPTEREDGHSFCDECYLQLATGGKLKVMSIY
jgi:Zn finger protein HypA/HybF involved in hydrogenase expression